MRELDILLERYLEHEYGQAAAAEKAAFQRLLTLADPDLAAYLLRGEPHEEVLIANVIERILSRTAA